jgi:hypothetical protein
VTFLSAIWIGTVIAALLRTKLGKTARGKDIGKALSLIIALPVIALMYAIIGGGLLEALANPGTSGLVKNVLFLFPSSWGADLFVLFAANPANLGAIWFDTLIRFGGLILFFVAALWLGAKAADRAYTLETTSFTPSSVKNDRAFYRSVKSLGGGGSSGTLLVSIFKDYSRRFENLSKIAYIAGLLILITVFLGYDNDSPLGALVMGIFIFPLFAAFVVGEVTVRGKENFFIFRKAPLGEGRLVKARLLQAWLVVLPFAAIYGIFALLLVPQISIVTLALFTVLLVGIVAANVAFALGLFLLMPVFTDKPAELMGNAMILMMTTLFLFFFSSFTFGATRGMLVLVLLSWLTGIVFLLLGTRNLSRIE